MAGSEVTEDGDLAALVASLLRARQELEWIEFKENGFDPAKVGEAISALANTAPLFSRQEAYVVWGIRDGSCDVVGTTIDHHTLKRGVEPIESWLLGLLEPRVDFRFEEANVGDRRVLVLRVPAARHQPVAFQGRRYIRVGPSTRELRTYPEKENELWRRLRRETFEEGIAAGPMDVEGVLESLDVQACFKLLQLPLPGSPSAVAERLAKEGLVRAAGGGNFEITNLGVVLFAHDLTSCPALLRKAVRVVKYSGVDRTKTERDMPGHKGYASGFSGLNNYIRAQLPQNEHIKDALRVESGIYPQIAVRELIANALIHQDFWITGSGPLVEIFTDRIEISNPGAPLIPVLRFIDAPPRSRNERLGALTRRLGLCEERGSGIDRVVSAVELFQLPSPEFRSADNATLTTLFAPRKLTDLTRPMKVRACYQHACLQHVSGRAMTNESLRKRFAIEEHNYSTASRIIAATLEEGLIRRQDPSTESKRYARYVPFWAA